MPEQAPMSLRRAAILTTLSAVLTSLSFVPYNLHPLGFIGLIPVFYVFEHFTPNKKQMFQLWVIWIMTINLIGYHWIMHTIAVYGMMPHWIAFPLFLLYSLGTGSKMLLFFIFLKWMRRRPDLFPSDARRLLGVTAAFGACEIIGWQLFPWHGGNIVSGNLAFAQGADLIGTRGLSVIWVALQYLLFVALLHERKTGWPETLRTSRAFRLFAGILVITHAYGALRLWQFSSKEKEAPKILVGVPQGNVPLITSFHERPYIIARMIAQTQRLISDTINAGHKIDLVVWPESSIPAMEYERSPELRMAIGEMQKATNTPVIINDILHDRLTAKDYSNMWHLDETGKALNNYQKNFLLPFGEFMPLGDKFPALKNLFPAVSDFSHGEKFSLFEIATKHGTVRAMPLVCYEVILPDYARGFDARTDRQGQFIINITNDAWFGDSVESLQHMTLGVMRAIELRLPILRSTNSGISAYISTTGSVSGETKLFERVNAVYQVPAMPRQTTVFSFIGNLPLYLFLVFAAGFTWFRRRR